MDKDAAALALYCQGKMYRQIAIELGWKNQSSAFAAVKRALADRQRDKLEQVDHFAAAVQRVQAGIAACQEIIDAPHYLAAPGGKLATAPDGSLVLDDGPKQRALTEQRHLNDQLIMLMDLKPASKQRVEVVTEAVVDREIEKLAKELAEAGKNQPVPPEVPR
jgi:hypothetical protein